MDMDDFADAIAALVAGLRSTIRTEFTSIWLPIQLGTIVVAALLAVSIAALVRKRFDLSASTMGWPAYLRLTVRAITSNFHLLIFIIIVAVLRVVIRASIDHPRTYMLGVAVDLSTAWVVIAIATSLIRNQFVNRVVAVTAWTIAALSITRLLGPVADGLDSISVMVGGLKLTPLLLLKTSAMMLFALWVAMVASNFFDRRVRSFSDLTPSIQVLIGKLIRIVLMTFAIVIVLSSMGIDLSVLAVFSGAVGVGLGFGLQKIVSNLVSGIILLADKSIKPGDVISVGDHFGIVGNMGARYTSVDTRDGREYLIPNEDFITQRVANWTYSSDLVRVSAKFNTTYDSEPRKVMEAAVAAALSVERVAKKPKPACMLSAFGASALEFELWFWMQNPAAGVANIKSEVLLALWDALDAQGVHLAKPGPARVIYELAQPPSGKPDGPPDGTLLPNRP